MEYSVILAGGSGTRLWPASRRNRPKQFLPLAGTGPELLIQAAARRLSAVTPGRVKVVTQADQAEQVRQAVSALPADAIVSEPAGRNTAAAIGLSCAYLLCDDPQAVAGFVPADQTVGDEPRFLATARQALALARSSNQIITIGIVPARPDTAFGYIEVGRAGADGARTVKRFVEKPDKKTAEKYLASGDYLWNAGMFFAPARLLFDEICRHMPDTGAILRRIETALRVDRSGARAVIDAEYARAPSVSIDYGVMEKTDRLLCLPGDFGWNDVGSWTAVSQYAPADENGNAVLGTAVAVNARNNIIYSEGSLIAVVGVDNLVVVQAGNAILVVPRDQAESVRDAAALLKQKKLDQYL